MRYPDEVYEEVRRVYEARRLSAEKKQKELRENLYAESEELKNADMALRKLSQDFLSSLAVGNTAEDLLKKADSLFGIKKAALQKLGEKEDALEPHYVCKDCKDTGYVNGTPCHCLETEIRKAALRLSQMGSAVNEETFDNFSLEYYPATPLSHGKSAREIMKINLDVCRNFAEKFGKGENLFMTGGVGLGKTHLSSAIAGKVIEKGFSVKYITAPSLFEALENSRFGRGGADSDMLSPDLLIIDDLGSEFITTFTVAALFSVINGRMLNKKSTIISTNLTFQDFENQYGDKVASRVGGTFTMLHFVGNDIRMEKRKEESK